MSTEACLALLLDGPMQSWGESSRFERRATSLHPTRSGVLGLVAAAMGIDKHAPGEAGLLARLGPLRMTVAQLDKRDSAGRRLPIHRLEDYHTVTGIRRAGGKVDPEATVQTYRHYLVDARFGVLLEGPAGLLGEIAAALRDPKWGLWLGRKCCAPACPPLVAPPGPRGEVWRLLLLRAQYSGGERLEEFDHVVEVGPGAGAERVEDQPLGYGLPIGQRHGPRWIRRVPKTPRTARPT